MRTKVKTKKKMSPQKRKRIIKENLAGYGFIMGNVVIVCWLMIYPFCFAVKTSFQQWNPIAGGRWVGLSNYMRMFSDPIVKKAVINSLGYAFWTILGGLILCYTAAVMVRSLPNVRVRNILKFIFFIPAICNTIMVSYLWSYMVQDAGLINTVLRLLGADSTPKWFGDATWSTVLLYIIIIWSGLGYWMIIFLTRLMDIPETYYEAAKIDGAGFWGQLRHITLPLSTPVIYLYLSMALITCWQTFDIPTALNGMLVQGGFSSGYGIENCWAFPMGVIYRAAFNQMDFGYAMALGIALLIFILIIGAVNNRLSKKWVNYD